MDNKFRFPAGGSFETPNGRAMANGSAAPCPKGIVCTVFLIACRPIAASITPPGCLRLPGAPPFEAAVDIHRQGLGE